MIGSGEHKQFVGRTLNVVNIDVAAEMQNGAFEIFSVFGKNNDARATFNLSVEIIKGRSQKISASAASRQIIENYEKEAAPDYYDGDKTVTAVFFVIFLFHKALTSKPLSASVCWF